MIDLFHKPVRWWVLYLKKRLNERQFLLLACIVVGASASLAGVALKLFVFKLEELFFSHSEPGNILWLQVLVPAVGIGVSSILINKWFKQNFQKGNDKIVYAIAKQGSNLPFSQAYSQLLTSGVTVGLGGSAGLESPMVASGAAIGANFGRNYFLPYSERTILIASGVASGIASAFSAPIAGVLFALEVLMIDLAISSFIPIIISAATGALISRIILGDKILLSFSGMQPFNYNYTLLYILLGIVCGVMAIYYARVFTWIGHKFGKYSPVKKWLVGSSLLAILIFFFPSLFGEGYSTIKSLAETNNIDKTSFVFAGIRSEWLLVLLLAMASLLKVFATAFTLNGGGNGGSFAPSLFTGGIIGFVLAQSFHLLGYHQIPTANFIVVGMAGSLSGIFYAPLTAIFLSAEITGGYNLIIPLMMVSAISFMVVKYYEPLSMEMKKLSRRTKLNLTDKDKFLLSRIDLEHLVDTGYLSFSPDTLMKDAINKILNDDKDAFAVVNEAKKLLGVVYLNDIKSFLLNDKQKLGGITVSDVMRKKSFIHINDTVEETVYRFEQLKLDTLAIVDDNDTWIGFVTKTAVLDKYRGEILRQNLR